MLIFFYDLIFDEHIVGVGLDALPVHLDSLNAEYWISGSVPVATLRQHQPATDFPFCATMAAGNDCHAVFPFYTRCGVVARVRGYGAVARVRGCGVVACVRGYGVVARVRGCGVVAYVRGYRAVACVRGCGAVARVRGYRAVARVRGCGVVARVRGCGVVARVGGCGEVACVRGYGVVACVG